MPYEVKILADSISPAGARITTYQLKYPRMIHAEFMTHRAISRNASSTRAIPTAKMLEWVEKEPAVPVYWGSNKSGMQAGSELDGHSRQSVEYWWNLARVKAISAASSMCDIGLHKQIASRVLEPFAHINVVATATAGGWINFFALRCHEAAMPEIQALAVPMARAYRASEPIRLEDGQWHLPYVSSLEASSLGDETLRKVSVARCARVSYRTFDGRETGVAEDAELHDRLEANGHWSPFEHQATPASPLSKSGNFLGWEQYRQGLARSVHRSFDFSKLDTVYADRDFVV